MPYECVSVKAPERPSPYAVTCPTCGAWPATRCKTRWTKVYAAPHRTRITLAATPRGPAATPETKEE